MRLLPGVKQEGLVSVSFLVMLVFAGVVWVGSSPGTQALPQGSPGETAPSTQSVQHLVDGKCKTVEILKQEDLFAWKWHTCAEFWKRWQTWSVCTKRRHRVRQHPGLNLLCWCFMVIVYSVFTLKRRTFLFPAKSLFMCSVCFWQGKTRSIAYTRIHTHVLMHICSQSQGRHHCSSGPQ